MSDDVRFRPLVSAGGRTREIPREGFFEDDLLDSGERDLEHLTATLTLSGEVVLIDPAPDQYLRIRWINALNNPTSQTPALISARLGSRELYRAYGISKRQRVTGSPGESFAMSLNRSGEVPVSVTYELCDVLSAEYIDGFDQTYNGNHSIVDGSHGVAFP